MEHYHGLEFEPSSPLHRLRVMETAQPYKEGYTFPDSLKRLRAAGFQRHPRSDEAFGVLFDGLEGKLGSPVQEAHENMLSDAGEWLSLAFERSGDVLIAYIDPEGLKVEKTGVFKRRFKRQVKAKNFSWADRREFNITVKPSDKYNFVPIDEFDDDLVQFIYGRTLKDFPRAFFEGPHKQKKSVIALPNDNEIWPIGHGTYSFGRLGFVMTYAYRASRGIRMQPRPVEAASFN